MTDRGHVLLRVAREALEAAFGGPPAPAHDEPWLQEPRAVFVTLEKHGELRGCVGQLEPRLSLLEAVRDAARGAAFRDGRFPPLAPEELPEVQLEVSVLSPLERLEVASEREALASLRPGLDGLVLSNGGRRGVFIPEVWKQLPDPADFLAQLKRKAGLPPLALPGTRYERFTAERWSEGAS